ncbi:MAG: hypothetical protein V1793_18215 [Pseudomonadota bacterium]
MVQKITIDSLDTTRLTCPCCARQKTIQVSALELSKPETRVRVRCICGSYCHVILEKKDQRANDLRLPGTFSTHGGSKQYGRMTVKRLNSLGLVFTVIVGLDLAAGQKLLLEFVLDDVKQSIVRKEAVVIAVNQRHVSVRFTCPDHFDNLGPYIFFNRLNAPEAV